MFKILLKRIYILTDFKVSFCSSKLSTKTTDLLNVSIGISSEKTSDVPLHILNNDSRLWRATATFGIRSHFFDVTVGSLVVVVKPLDVVNEIKIDDSFPSIASVMAYLIASDFPVD